MLNQIKNEVIADLSYSWQLQYHMTWIGAFVQLQFF